MCFDLDSLPPIPVISGAAVSHEDLVLEARDGNRFAAFLATPDESTDTDVASSAPRSDGLNVTTPAIRPPLVRRTSTPTGRLLAS